MRKFEVGDSFTNNSGDEGVILSFIKGTKTPHRGTQATENVWRVFVRLTHKSITPVSPVTNYIRRHCQVYLDPTTFSW